MAPLPIWFELIYSDVEGTTGSGDVSKYVTAAGTSILQARRETYDFAVRALQERAKGFTPKNGFVPGGSSKPASSFNNQAILAIFASLGAVMVLAGIWFFFFAKNGGFQFEEGDWDDYKSTVLRRKGPDGKTLTNATKSTKLGGSTIVGTQHFKWAKQSAKSVVSYDEKGRKGILARRGWGKTHSVTYGDDFTEFGDSRTISDEMTEVQSLHEPRDNPQSHTHSKHHRDRDVQDYKKEKPARVGGLNRIPDGSHVDTTNSDASEVHSETNSDRPILKKDREKEKDRDHAERRARAEAAKMERRWKKEAEEAAAAFARESGQSVREPKKAATPSKPSGTRQRSESRSASPKKRDFSYQTGPESEVFSTSQNGTSSRRTTSYFEQYRPPGSDSRGYSSDHGNARQSSPSKKTPGRGGGGYRRGADSDFD